MKRFAAVVGVGVLVCAQGWAQTIPGSAQPGRVEEQIPAPQAPSRVEVEVPEAQKAQEAPAQAEMVKFTLNSVQVEGLSVYTPPEMEAIYRPLLGQVITLADLYKVAAAMTDKYRRDGYLLSQVIVPEQDVSAGNAKLVAVEGFIDSVYIQTEEEVAHLGESKNVAEMTKRISGMKPVTVEALERNLLLIGDLPGLEVKGVLKASPSVQKAADLYVLISRKRVEGQVTINNRGSRYLGPGQGLATLTVNNVIDENDAITVRGATTAQTREMKYGEINYKRVLGPSGLTLDVNGSTAVTHPGASLEPFEVMGQDTDVFARLTYPLTRSRNSNVNVYGEAGWNNVKTKILGTEISKDKIRTLRAGATYSGRDKKLGANSAIFQVTQGLDAFGASERGDATSRPRAKPDFTKLNATLSREQALKNSQFSLFGAVSGQYSSSPLLAPEEFGLGGEMFGSAYDPSEVTGDSGAAMRLEGRYTSYPYGKLVNVVQPYAFYDLGMVHNRDPGVGVNKTQTLASYGAGVRVYAKNDVNAAVEVADPISRAVAASGNRTSPRVFFKIQKAF